MLRRLPIALPLLTLLLLVPAVVGAQEAPGDEAGVRAAVEAYLRAHATGDASHIRPVFHPMARLFFVRDGELATVTGEEYMGRMSGGPAPDEADRRRWIESIDVTGTAATAKVVLDYPGAVLTDYFALLRIDGEWRIVNKIFHVEPK